MDNQHRQIKGYRELTAGDITAMNAVKEVGEAINLIVILLEADKDKDQRAVAIGKEKLQTGLMWLTRSVAKPTFF